MLNKLMDMLNEKGYQYNMVGDTVEVRFPNNCAMVFVIVNNQCKVYKYVDDSIVSESKWYKRLHYAVKYLTYNA